MKMTNPSRWSVRSQIAMLLIATQVFAHVATTVIINLSTLQTGGGQNNFILSMSEPMLTALRTTSGPMSGTASEGFATLVRNDDRFHMAEHSPLPANMPDSATDPKLNRVMAGKLPPPWRDRVLIYSVDATGDEAVRPTFKSFRIAARLQDGHWLVFEPHGNTLVENVPRVVVLLGLLFLGLPLMFLSVWSGAVLVSPIGALARGAERFSKDIDAPELVEKGPKEVRQATRAFNLMRQRIQKLISDRGQTLASIGHDMRTPLTRLRLRLELLENGHAKAAIDEDIRVLERMIDDALEFLRAESRPPVLAQIDLAVLVRTVANEYADGGHQISYEGPQRFAFRCDHDLMLRILDNIVANAAKFASRASVALIPQKNGSVRIEVRDDGPGIPLDHRDRVLEPFARLEAVRAGTAQNSQGFGLGLAIARDLTERHGGQLTLSDNVPRGLLVVISLPVQTDPDQSERQSGE
jgi:signal transduction histidine kinase